MAGGPLGFREIEVMTRGAPSEVLPVDVALALYPEFSEVLERIVRPATCFAGIDLEVPAVMGIVNVTPDSFSDGGDHCNRDAAVAHALGHAAAGAAILDVGGESTRPGAQSVPVDEEIARVVPVIEGVRRAGCALPISIDTRKAAVARAAFDAGATILNDVSALGFDPAIPEAAQTARGLCLMHARGTPETMQADPRYGDVLLDVYDYLAERVSAAEALGFRRADIMIDPGIGFGKTIAHNLTLIRGLSLFQGLGCGVMIGVSRKGFIGTISGQSETRERFPGSIAAGLSALGEGAHLLRVHDVAETVQALRVHFEIARIEA